MEETGSDTEQMCERLVPATDARCAVVMQRTDGFGYGMNVLNQIPTMMQSEK